MCSVVVVVVGLFHTYLKYKYFYNDKCIEIVRLKFLQQIKSIMKRVRFAVR